MRQQARLLNGKIDPPEPEYEPPAYHIEQAGLDEQLKDRWNREVEGLVRKAQTTDWEAVRIRWENRISTAFDRIRNTEKAHELEQRFKEKVIGTEDNTQLVKESVKEAVQGKRLLEEK